MIGKLTSSIARTFALALTICATGGASAAVKPLAVWNGDFVDGAERGGYTLSKNGNGVEDGVITIKSSDNGSSGGITVLKGSCTDRPMTVIAAFEELSVGNNNIALATSKVYYEKGTTTGDYYNRTGLSLQQTDSEFYGWWNNDGTTTTTETGGIYTNNGDIFENEAFSPSVSRHYIAYCYTSGVYGYDNGMKVYYRSGLHSGDDQGVYGFSVGGLFNSAEYNATDAKIKYLAILDSNSADDISAWSPTSMTSAENITLSDGEGSLTGGDNVGVNLNGGTVTVSGNKTAAALFVQADTTLKFANDSNLAVSGPIYVADGASLNIDASADGASLNIDASAIPLSVSNPTYTIFTGTIMGTVSVTALPTAPEGFTAVAYVTDAYVAIALQKSVSITSPFDGTTLASPTMATICNSDAETVAFGNDMRYWQTVDGKDAIVANVTGGAYSTAVCGFFSQTTALDTSRDVYMVLSGGSGRLVCGVQKCSWVGNGYTGSYETTGDAIVQIEGGTWQYVFGAGAEGAYSASAIGKVIGSTGVTLTGSGKVSGSVFGGWGSSHARNPTVTQNTSVRVENVQDVNTAGDLHYVKKGYIVGGSTYQASDANSCTTVSGNSSVIVDLDSEASGTFVKNIIGGSMLPDAVNYDQTGQRQAVAGNSSVSIVAPSAVEFTGKIIGGGYSGRGSNGGSSTVGGIASVTLTGGTYSGLIVAGGYAPNGGNVSVAGTATLTLNGGTFSGATISAGTASGTKSILIGGDVDLSGTTINDSGFDGLSVSATKTLSLGEKRLVGASDLTLTTIGDGGKVSFKLTSAEETAKHAVLIKCSVADVSGKFTILDSSGADITSSVADKVSVRNGYLVYMDVNTYTVTIGSVETAWDSVSWTLSGASETMATAAADVNAEATLTLDGGTLVISDAETFAGKLTITGTGTVKFTGNATLTSDLDITIDSGVMLDFSGLTNLTSMGSGDTIISAVAITISTSSVVYPSTWTCTYSTSSSRFAIAGFNNISDSVSINIIGGATSLTGKRIASDGVAGFYPVTGSQWNQIAQKTSTDAVSVTVDVSERLASGDISQEAGMIVTATAKNAYTAAGGTPTGANADLMYGYLDDGNSGANITVKNIPYSQYAVLVYMGTDQTSDAKNFRPVTVNSISYCGSGSRTVEGSTNWGVYTSARGTVTLAEGSNYLKVTGLTSSTLTVQGSTGSDGYRCGIAGIQIVNTGTRPAIYSATLDGAEGTLLPSGESTGMTKTSVGSWSGSTTAKIILTNPTDVNSTVTIGENITTGSLKIRGAGTVTLAIGDSKTLAITNGKVDLTEFSGTLCVDTTVPYSFFAANDAYKTNDGIVRFLGENLEFTGEASLPFGKIAFHSATLKSTGTGLESTYRTVVVEEGDSVTIDSGVKNTSLNFDVRGGSLTMASTDKFWFGAGSRFNQTGGTVTYACEGTQTSTSESGCSIFGYSSSGTTVTISGGIFDMGKSTLNLWQDGSTLTLSGNAQFKVRGIIANDTAGRTVSVGGSSKLILTGTLGLHTSLATVTLSGGTIELQETATIEKQLTLAASTESAIIVAASKTATLSGGVTGTGTLKLAGAGTIANSTALTNVGAIDFTDGLTVNTAVTLAGGAVISVGDDDVTIGGAVTQSGTLVIDGSAITSGDPSDTITITASSGTFTVANVSTQNMPGSWTLDTTNSTGTELKLVASEVATVGNNSYATIAAAIAAANSGATKTVTLTSNTGDSSTPVTIPEGVTVNFGSHTLTCGTLTVGSGVVVNMANISATKVEGSGTVIYDGTYPVTGLGWTDADNWRGTLVIKSISGKQGLVLNNIGNENSVVRLDGVSDAYFDGSQEAKPTLDLDGSGLTLHYANSYNVVILSKLTGSGPLSITGGSSYGAAVVVKESSLFTGAITLQAGCQQQLIFGDSGSDATSAKIIVNSGKIATVPTGTTWSAAGGFDVNGTLAFDGTGSVGSNVTTSNGSTLDFSGFTGTTPAISGSLTLASGTTIKLSDSATLPYQIATAGNGGLIDNVTVQIGDGTPVTGTVALSSGTITELAPVDIDRDKTYTVSDVFGTPSAASSYEINVTSDATVTVPETAVGTILYNFTANGNTITLSGGYKIPAAAQHLKITDASSLTADNYTLFQWTTKQIQSAGYGAVSSLDVTGLPANLSAELVYCVDKIVLRVYDTAAQAAKGTLKIWAYGDSITEGFNLADTCANYRGLLCQKLSLLGFNVETVGCYDKISNAAESSELMPKDPAGQDLPPRWRWHSAKHGSTAGPTSADTRANLIENVDSLCAQVGKPDVVLLHIGVNDLGASKDFTGATMTKEIVFKSWTNVVWHLVNNLPESKIIVSTLLYGNASSASRKSSNAKIKEFNELVRAQMNLTPGAAGAFPSRVILADLNTYFETTETEAAPAGITIDTGIDYLHPDWWGCDQMADGWLSAITDVSKANFSPDDAFPSATPLVAPTSEQLGAAAKAELATYLPGFRRVCYLEAAHGLLTNLSDAIPYVEKDDTIAANTYTKVGYFVEIVRSDNNAHQWVWVDMDAFGERNLEDVGLPVKNIQQVVTSLHVMSNHRGIETVAADDDSVSGFIEFSPYQLNPNASGVAGAPADENDTYDWNDTLLNNYGSFACMQVHRIAPSSGRAAQVLFAYNNWRSAIDYPAELGIGNLSQHFFKVSGKKKSTDWTATSLSSTLNTSKYKVKRIEIWAKPVYTATMSSTGDFSGLEFSPTLPGDISACDLVINVTDDPTLTSVSTIEAGSITLNISEGATLTLDANAVISEVTGAGTLNIAAGRTVTLTSNTALDGIASLTGTGTLVLPVGTAPSSSLSTLLSNANWQGTVVVSGYDGGTSTALPIASWGNSGSTLKLSGVKGCILAGVNPAVTINPDIELADGAYGYGLWLNAGYSYSANTRQYTDILCLKGDGTLVGSDGASTTLLRIADWDDFTGALTLNNKVVVFGADAALPEPSAINDGGYIIVGEGESVTVPNGKTWTLAKGAIVNGTLTNASGSLAGTGSGLKFYGSGVVTQCVAGAVNHGTEVHGSLSVVFSGADAKFGPSSISMDGTATLTFDPGAGNTYTNSYELAAATTNNKVIVKSGTLHPTITFDDAQDSKAFNLAEIVIENGGELLLTEKDTTGYDRCDAPIRVKTGGVLNVAYRETMAHDLYLEGGVLRITGEQQDRGLDLFKGRCTIYATEDSTIEATGDYPIYVRDNDATNNVAEGKTLICNCAFLYHMQDGPTDAFSTNDIIKTGAGTLVLNGQSGNPFALPKGLVVNAGTVEVNTTLQSNGRTGDAANYYTVASGAKLKVGATGQVNAATLTLNDGSLLEFGGVGNTSTAFIEVNTAEFASGTTTVSFSSGVTPTVGAKLISWTGKPAGAFSLEASLAASYALVSDATGLSIANGVAVVNGTAYATLQDAIDASAGSATVTLIRNSSESVTLNAKQITFVENSGATFTGTFSGTGTLKLPEGALFKSPSDEMWDSDWEGTVWISGVESIIGAGDPNEGEVLFEPNKYGREGSTLKLSGVKGWILAGVNPAVTINPDIELADGAYGYGLWLNNGYSYWANNLLYTDILCLKGDGTLVGSDGAPTALLRIADWDDFAGALTLTNKVVVFDTDAELPGTSAISGGGYIIVGVGESVTVPNGKTWTLANGAIVNGTLTNLGSLVGTGGAANFTVTVASGAKLKVGDSGHIAAAKLTLNNGSLLEFGGVGNTSTAFIEVGTAEFASGTTTVSFSSGVTPTVGAKLISWTGKPAGAFSLEPSLAASYALVSEATGLSIANGVAVVNGTAYATLQDAIDASAGSGQTITLLRDLEYAPASSVESVEIGNLNIGNHTLTLTTCAADQVISVTNLAGTGSVFVNSSVNPGVGRVAFTGENTGFTGSITVADGGTLVAESATPWKASSTTSEGMARVTVNGTLMLTHGAYMHGIVLKQVTWGESSRLELVESVEADGSITVSNDYASGEPATWAVVDIYRVALDGVTKTSNDVSSTDTYTYKPHVSGSACLLDFTFTNTVRVVSGTYRIYAASTSQWKDPRKYSLKTDWDGKNTIVGFLHPNTDTTNGEVWPVRGEMWPVYTNYVDTVEPHQYTALHGLIRPFRGTDDDDNGNVEAHAVYFLPNDRPCSAFVAGTIPSEAHTCFVSFGSTQGGIFLATGDTPDEVDLIYVKSTDVPYDAKVHFRREHCTKLTTMRVPYGDAAQHTVVFETSDHQTYDIYLDGELWTRYTFPDRIEIKHGFHIGSWIGGDNEAERYYRKLDVDTAPHSYISAIRIYGTALGTNAIAALAAEFPYVSPGVGYERILTTSETTESWSQANAWRNVAESDVFTETVPADMSSLVTITNDSSVVKTIEVNLDRTQKIESLTVSGAQPVRFEKGTGLVAIYGKVTIDTDVYNEYGALDMFGVPLEIAVGKHLTLDLTNMPIDDYYEVTHIRISGYSTEPANPEATTPEQKAGWPLIPLFPRTKRYDFDVEYNMTDHSYYLVLYPNHTHVDDVQGNPSGFINVRDETEAVLTQLTGRDYVLPAAVNKVSVEYGKYDITKVFNGGDVGGLFFITNIVDGKVHPTLNPEASIEIDGQTISVSPVVAAVRVDGNDVAAMADGDNESVMFGVKTIPGLWYAVATSEDGNNFTVDYDSVQQATGTALKLESDELHNSQKIRLFRILASESKAELGTAKSVSTVLSYVNDTDYRGLNAHGMDIDEGAVAGFGPVVYGLKVAGSEDGDFFDDTFRSLTFNLNGTATDGKVYALKNADGFTVATATSASGSVTFSLGPNAIANGTLYLVAPETMLETVGVASYKWNGQETATSVDQTAQIPLVMLANTPAKDGLKSVNTDVSPDSTINTGNRNVGSVYRIPAIANNGTNIVAMFDCRYLNHNDLGTTWAGDPRAIDQAICESADSGLTWTSPTIAIDVPNYNNGVTGVAVRECDFGDPCLGFFNHKFYVMAQTGVGLQGSDTNDNDLVMYSRDEEVGSAWGNRTSVQAAIMSALETARGEDAAYPETRGILQGPGHAIVSNYELHFPMQYFPLKNSGNNPRVFVASLASDGTWTATKLTAGAEDAEEPSLAVLDNGDWYMIAKDGAGGSTGGRHVFVSKDKVSWTKVAKQFEGETPPVQGSMLKVGTKDGHGVYVAAMDTGSKTGDGTNDGRRDIKLFIGTDASSSTYNESSVPITWTSKAQAIMIYNGYTEGQGYNSIVQIDATTIGILFEAAKHIYFKKVDISTYVDVN